MINDVLLNKYASLIVRTGVNVVKGQSVLIKCSVEVYEFARLVVKQAYEAGASKVYVDYNDSVNTRNGYIYQDIDTLCDIEDFVILREKNFIDKNICKISLTSSDPTALAGVDSEKILKYGQATSEKLLFARDYNMKNYGQWTVAGVPTYKWATKVFKDLDKEEALEKLWEAILSSCRVDMDHDPIDLWNEHLSTLKRRVDILNKYDFDRLVFKNSYGTNLEIGLVNNHIFAGGSEERNPDKVVFLPNIPTEEIFGMPHRQRVNGVVHSTRPLVYQGNLIDDFYLEFKDGAVVNFGAKVGYENLSNLVNFDKGSNRLGEVALVTYDSPISLSNVLFYNTLFDENASCHLALGESYGVNIKDGFTMSEEDLLKEGANRSNTHVDFMFGSKCMNIVGYTKDNEEVQVFVDGNFVF